MAGETFKETLAEVQTYFALSKEEVSKNRRTNDKEVRRSTVNFPIEDNDRRKSSYRYRKTSLSFRLDHKRPTTLLVSSNAGNILEAERKKEFQLHENSLKVSKYLTTIQSPTVDKPFEIFSPIPDGEREKISGIAETEKLHRTRIRMNSLNSVERSDSKKVPFLTVELKNQYPTRNKIKGVRKNSSRQKLKLCNVL